MPRTGKVLQVARVAHEAGHPTGCAAAVRLWCRL
jgi:hypothetical protein